MNRRGRSLGRARFISHERLSYYGRWAHDMTGTKHPRDDDWESAAPHELEIVEARWG